MQKNLLTNVNINSDNNEKTKCLSGNIWGGNFQGGNSPGGNWMVGNFQGGSFHDALSREEYLRNLKETFGKREPY